MPKFHKLLEEGGIDALHELEAQLDAHEKVRLRHLTKVGMAIMLWLTLLAIFACYYVRRHQVQALQVQEMQKMRTGVPDVLILVDGCTVWTYVDHTAKMGKNDDCK